MEDSQLDLEWGEASHRELARDVALISDYPRELCRAVTSSAWM
jgi:hypothetical protein